MKKYVKSASSSKDSSLDPYRAQNFDQRQLTQIQKGLESGVDVNWYADPKFDYWQMWQIREGLEAGLDVSVYADPKFDHMQMGAIREGLEEIRKGVESGVDVSLYADPKFNGSQKWQIREGLEADVDASIYADPKFDWIQMEQIRLGLESGVDVSQYADPNIPWWKMKEIREGNETHDDSSDSAWINFEDYEYYLDYDSEEFNELWSSYLGGPEADVNEELKIYPEPSTQGGSGAVFIHDESGEDRWDSFSKFVDYGTWCEKELEMAQEASSPEEYKNLYRNWILSIIER